MNIGITGGRIKGFINEEADGLMDGWTGIGARINGWTHRRMDGLMDEEVCGQIDRWTFLKSIY